MAAAIFRAICSGGRCPSPSSSSWCQSSLAAVFPVRHRRRAADYPVVPGRGAISTVHGKIGVYSRPMMKPAVVLLSGGLDSATCLAIARAAGFACYCLSCDYGQRHNAELRAAERVVRALGAVEHRVINFGLAQFGGSALTDTSIAVPVDGVQPGIA